MSHFSLEVSPDAKTAAIYVHGRDMKRRWRGQEPPLITKMNFRTDLPSGLSAELRSLLRDLLNLGCAVSLRHPRFRKVIFVELNPLGTTSDLYRIWRNHTREDLSGSGTYGGHPPTGMVGMSWRPTR